MKTRAVLSTNDRDLQVIAAHYLISTKGGGVFEPAEVALGLEWTPRSLGRDILDLGFYTQKLNYDDPFETYGHCESYGYREYEKRLYRLLAWQAESLMDPSGPRYGRRMKLRLASMAMRETVNMPVCKSCNSAGCKSCEWWGREHDGDWNRIRYLETHMRNWHGHLRAFYIHTYLPTVANQGREAARSWLRAMQEVYPDKTQLAMAKALGDL